MPPAPATAAPTFPLAPTCEVRDWTVFGPGVHKGGFYSPEMCDRVPANFDRLRSHLTPLAKIGHDRAQRLAKSLGFINVGKVVKCVPVGNGNFALTIIDIPTAVGGEINAGRLNSGSVELLPKIADPDDPSKDIPGPVLAGVAFLGEEQPAVKGFRPPRAVFADGTPVPPAHDPAPWLNAMADVTTLSANSEPDHAPRFSWFGREYAAQTISFSEMNQMDPKAQLAALGLTPEQIEQAMQICAGAAPPAAPVAAAAAAPPAPGAAAQPAPMSADEGKDMPPWAKEMSAKFADMEKRVGAQDKFAEDLQKKDDEAKMAAFSAEVDRECLKIAKKVAPAVIASVVRPAALGILTARTFSSESDRVKTFSDYFAGFAALPDDPRLKSASVAANAKTLSPLAVQMARRGGILDRTMPDAAKALRTGKPVTAA